MTGPTMSTHGPGSARHWRSTEPSSLGDYVKAICSVQVALACSRNTSTDGARAAASANQPAGMETIPGRMPPDSRLGSRTFRRTSTCSRWLNSSVAHSCGSRVPCESDPLETWRLRRTHCRFAAYTSDNGKLASEPGRRRRTPSIGRSRSALLQSDASAGRAAIVFPCHSCTRSDRGDEVNFCSPSRSGSCSSSEEMTVASVACFCPSVVEVQGSTRTESLQLRLTSIRTIWRSSISLRCRAGTSFVPEFAECWVYFSLLVRRIRFIRAIPESFAASSRV